MVPNTILYLVARTLDDGAKVRVGGREGEGREGGRGRGEGGREGGGRGEGGRGEGEEREGGGRERERGGKRWCLTPSYTWWPEHWMVEPR